jgi:CTP:molybdopterin cytidylyltransferase MocA
LIAGLILAAGDGSRFGAESKLVADLDGKPLLQYALNAQCAVPELERVVVVLGAHADDVRARVRFGRAEPVMCEDWSSGQAASLRCGLRALRGADKVIVTLGDQPLITPDVVRRFVNAPAGARAVYNGTPGHPVVLGSDQYAAVERLEGDQGARELLQGGERIECAHLASGRDVDTRNDLETVRDEARAIV